MQPQNKSAIRKCKQHANKTAKNMQAKMQLKKKQTKKQKKCEKKCKFWNCAFLHFWEGLRSSKVQKLARTRGKCKKNVKKMQILELCIFAFLGGPPVFKSSKNCKNSRKMQNKQTNNAKKMQILELCMFCKKTNFQKLHIFRIFDCICFAFFCFFLGRGFWGCTFWLHCFFLHFNQVVKF